MKLQIRKIVTFEEEIFIEGEKEASQPLKLFGVAAVVKNPWSGRGFVDDLKPEIKSFGPILGKDIWGEFPKSSSPVKISVGQFIGKDGSFNFKWTGWLSAWLVPVK